MFVFAMMVRVMYDYEWSNTKNKVVAACSRATNKTRHLPCACRRIVQANPGMF